jgi:hypothetical protein
MLTHTYTQKLYKLSMPEKNVDLSAHKMSWNSRKKLNFAQHCKQIGTHTIRVHAQKNLFKPQPEGYPVEWWMMHLFFCESTSLELNFCYSSLDLSCGYFQGWAQTTPDPPCTGGFLHFTQSAFFLFVLFLILVYLAGEKTQKVFNLPTSRGVSHTFALLPKPKRPGFTPDIAIQGSLGGDRSPLLPPKSPGSYQSEEQCSPPLLVPVFHRLHCVPEAFTTTGEWVPPRDQTVPWHLVGSLLPAVWGMHPGNKGGDKSLSPQSWQWASKKCCRISSWDTGHWGSLAGSNISLCWHRLSRLLSKGWAPRTKGSHLM